MTGKVDSIKLDDFYEYNSSLEYCNSTLTSLKTALDSYQRNKFKVENSIYFINDQLKDYALLIEKEKGYSLFTETVGAVLENKEGEIISHKVPLFSLILDLPDNAFPLFPWQQNLFNKYIYHPNIEQRYLDSEDQIGFIENQINIISRMNFDPILVATINQMRRNPRSREILELYFFRLLAKNIKEIDKDLSEGNQLQFDFFNNYPPRDMSDDVSKLFSQHFLKAKKEVQGKKLINGMVSPNSLEWDNLQQKLLSFKTQLLNIKNEHLNTIKDLGAKIINVHEKDKILSELYKDLQEFFKKNNLFKDDKFPSTQEIQKVKGGPGILKRINKGDGEKIKKMAAIKKGYQNFIDQQKKTSITNEIKSQENTSDDLKSKVEKPSESKNYKANS